MRHRLKPAIADKIPSDIASLPIISAYSRIAIRVFVSCHSRRAENTSYDHRKTPQTTHRNCRTDSSIGGRSGIRGNAYQRARVEFAARRLEASLRKFERGPDIIPVYPAPKSGAIQSPFDFRVKFQAHGNTRIDLDSLTIVYKRVPAIDLTARVKPFVRSDGIDMPIAEAPPGTHRILIFIKDFAGHEGQADIHFDVEK